jgi:hypothetical protein
MDAPEGGFLARTAHQIRTRAATVQMGALIGKQGLCNGRVED